tara:strand:+ start:132 stop:1493 length:1362 start_codon:yes stop_codon:yes gene_type:complete
VKLFKFFFLLLLIPITGNTIVHKHSLDNGLKIFVKEDDRAPIVVSQVWYRAGSLDEVNGKTGVAHLLEHMMFKGTKTTKPGEFSKIIAAAGGRENAFTGADYTCYFQQLEKSQLPISLKMEADRMQNLVVSEEEFAKEIKVVMEERLWRTDDNPKAQANELFNTIMFHAHPYGKPIVGWMNDLENMTHKDAAEWYENWYGPNNAILVVAGDVKASEVFKMAEKYFGKIPSIVLPERKPQQEPIQNGTRTSILKAPSKLSYVQMGYRAPTLDKNSQVTSKDQFALEVLVGILSQSSSARLTQNLVRDSRVALNVGAGYSMVNRGNESSFELYATPSETTSSSELIAALKDELNKIKLDGVTDEELKRVKTIVIAEDIYQKDSVFNAAMQIGQLETQGYSHEILEDYIKNIKKVTSKDIQSAAIKYFTDDTLTVVTIDPQPLNKSKPKKGKPHVH